MSRSIVRSHGSLANRATTCLVRASGKVAAPDRIETPPQFIIDINSKLIHHDDSALLALLCALLLPAMPAQAQAGNVWNITYWPNLSQGGFSPFQAASSQISFNWGLGSPMSGIPVDNFTMRATSSVWLQAGTYTFTALADDEVSLMIDGITWINTRDQGQSGKTISVTVPLRDSRWYQMQVDYREFTQMAYVFVNWSLVGAPPAPVPPVITQPEPSATSVQTRFGNYTPCIQNNTHQVNCFVPDGQWDSPN